MTPFEHYDALLREAEPTAKKYLTDADQRVRELRAKLRDSRIQVMLFGAYNAGKSTLINALLGSKQARVDDVPTTDVVSEYDWNGHVLLDTPGINAPIQHEEISQACLERTDLVLFVLRQEDQDAENVMLRIFDLLEFKRPVFLVLNYSDSDPALINEIRQTLNSTLVLHAQQRGVDLGTVSRVPVVLMNARSAERGRLENKAKLCEHAGYDDLMLRFREWLRGYDNDTNRLELVRAAVERLLLEPVLKSIDAKSSKTDESDELARQIAHLRREGRVLSDAAANRLRSELAAYRPTLAALFDQEQDAQAIIAEAEKIGDSIAESIHTWLSKELQESLERSIDASLRTTGLDVPEIERRDGEGLFEKSKGSLLTGAKKGATKENLYEALKVGRSLKIPGLKGRWTQTLDKWAGKAAPVIQVGLALVEIGMAHRDEQRANQESLDRAMQRNQWVEDICAQIRAGLMDNINESLNSIINEAVHPLETQQQVLLSVSDEIEKDRAHWRELETTFQSVRF